MDDIRALGAFCLRAIRLIGLKCMVLGYLFAVILGFLLELSPVWLVVFVWLCGINLAAAIKFTRVRWFYWV